MSNSTYTSNSHDWSVYAYDPNLGAPIFFAIAVSVIALYQAYICFFQTKWYKFGFMMTWGSTVFTAGFILRAISVTHQQSINLYIAQYVLVIAGPPILAGAEYFVLGRLFAYLPYHAPLNPHRVLSTFVTLGTAVESLTAAGAANSASLHVSEKKRSTGLACIKAALILQAVIEVCFLALLSLLVHRCRQHRYSGGRSGLPSNVASVCFVLGVTSVMMLVRCIYRVVEGFLETSCPASNPFCSSVSHTEVYFWIFEAANILLFLGLLAAPKFNPAKNLPSGTSTFLDPVDGTTLRVGPDWKDPRFWLWTVIDPFGLLEDKTQVDKYWLRSNEFPVAEAESANMKGSSTYLPRHETNRHAK